MLKICVKILYSVIKCCFSRHFEIAELGYIETLKPLYNVCGVSREYLERVKIDIENREELKEKIVDFVKENKESIENLKRE